MKGNKIAILLSFANDHTITENGISDYHLEALKDEEIGVNEVLDNVINEERLHLIRKRGLTPEILFDTFQENRNIIDIFHFSGHASEDSLQLEDDFDRLPDIISVEAVSELLKNQSGLRLVFLNGCNTNKQAEILCQMGIKVVIATNNKVGQYDACEFAIRIYKAIAEGASILEAFEEAKAFLKKRKDEDTSHLWEIFCKKEENKDWRPFPKNYNKNNLKILQLSDANLQSEEILQIDSSLDGDTDIVLYTGNILSTPSDVRNFEVDYKNLVEEITTKTGVALPNIFFSPGIYDLEDSKIMPAIHDRINSYKNNDDIALFTKSGEQYSQSCNATKSFRDVISKGYSDKEKNTFSGLYSTHVRQIGSKKIGIVSINILWSWNKTKEFVYPIELLEDAFDEIKSSDYKIILSNQELFNLRPFNKKEIENFVYSNFDFHFLGACDDKSRGECLMSDEGIYQSFSGLNQSNGIDYIYHDFNFETKKVKSYSHLFTDADGCIAEEVKENELSFPRGKEKNKQVKLLKTLNKQLTSYYNIADDLFVDHKKEGKSFDELFTKPIIKEKPAEEIQALNKNILQYQNKFIHLFDRRRNFIVYGKDKSGKSSLLIFIAIKILENFNRNKIIPVYIDLKDYKFTPNRLDIIRHISRVLEITRNDVVLLFEKYHVRLLLDNFDPSNGLISKKLSSYLEDYSSCSYILSSDQTTVRSYENFDFGFNHYYNLYIHPISRSEIRSFVTKSLDKSPQHIETIVQKLIDVFKQYHYPFNFWTVSVFIYILSSRRFEDFEVQNNSELIELYIQELLGQRELAHDTSTKFSFSKYKQYLSFLALKLYKEHNEDLYVTDYETLLKYTNEFISRSKRNVSTAEEIIEYIKQRGVLKRVSTNKYTFRLNGAFEYFLAKSMLENESFLTEILSDDATYLSFRNEFDLYSGFEKDDKEKDKRILKEIFSKTKKAYEKHNKRFEKEGVIDRILVQRVGNGSPLDIIKGIDVKEIEPLSYEDKDVLETEIEEHAKIGDDENNFNSEVQEKKVFDENASELEKLENYLFIMARVYRNIEIDDIEDEGLDDEIFEFILNSSCNYGFLLLEEIIKDTEHDKSKSTDNPLGLPKMLLLLIKNFIPLIVQDFFHNSVGHVTLENIIKSHIKLLEKDAKNNQFKLFVLYFTLLDLNLKANKECIDKVFKLTTIGVLKTSILIKVLHYLIFKAFDNKSLSTFLKNKFRSYQLKLNPKTDTSKLDQRLSEIEKAALIRKNVEKEKSNKLIKRT